MGNTTSDLLSLKISSYPTKITFTKHDDAFTQQVKFYNGREPSASFTLSKECRFKTFENLIPNKSYEYSWRTLTNPKYEWSDFMSKQVNTPAETVANNVALQRITGPYEVKFSVSEQEMAPVEKVKVRVVRDNNNSKTFELTNSQRFFTLKGLEPATLYTYYWSTQCKGKDRPSQEARGEFYTKKLRDIAAIFKDEATIKDEHTRLLDFLQSFTPPAGNKYINSVVIGRIGSGKSSFINSVASALKGEYCNKANAGNCSKSLTQEVRYIKLENAPKVNLVDLFGLDVTKPDLHTKIIKPLFEGEIPSRFTLSKAEELATNNQEYKQCDEKLVAKELRKMSGILFVVDHQSLDNAELTNQMAQYFTYVQQQGIPYTVVCTHIDSLFKDEKFEVKDMFTSPRVSERMAFFAESMGKTFSPENVYPFVNYTGSYEKKDLARDVLALKIMVNLVKSSTQYLQTQADDDEFL